MKKEIAEFIVNKIGKYNNYDVYENYSGRDMYRGETTTAIILKNTYSPSEFVRDIFEYIYDTLSSFSLSNAIESIWEYDELENICIICNELKNGFKVDSLGKNTIIY